MYSNDWIKNHQGCGSGSVLDPHSSLVLDPDPHFECRTGFSVCEFPEALNLSLNSIPYTVH